MNKSLLIIFSVVMTLSLSGCKRVRTEVSSFSSISPVSVGETFFILPSDQQRTSAEFMQYSHSVARRMSRAGWRRVDNLEKASYVVLMDYGVSGSKEIVSSIPIYGQTGGGTTRHNGTFNTYGQGGVSGTYSGTSYSMPTYGIVGNMIDSTTQFQRYFQLNVIERASNRPVYETKGVSSGSSGTFGQVAECMFDSALGKFPVPVNERDTILMKECGK